MPAATIRRLLVFGVCLVGVGILYLVPSLAGPSHPTPPRQQHAMPSAAPEAAIRRTDPPGRVLATAAPAGRDESQPAAVGRLAVLSTDPDTLVISWDEPRDDVGVVGYRVLVNGFAVLATQRTRATLAWFNDTNTHVVQVLALDAAGNEGPPSPTLLVTRPTPESSPKENGS